jgi:hypothetical protein
LAAVKVVHPHFANDPEYRQRFAREGAAAQQVGGSTGLRSWALAVGLLARFKSTGLG